MSLTCEQQRVVEHTSGHLVVIAGPGSGKTRTVIEKIRHILERDIVPPPYRLLAVTFTNTAVAEIKQRLRAGGFRHWDRIYVATFHSFANQLLNCYGGDIGIPENFELVSGDVQGNILAEVAERHSVNEWALRNEISACKRKGLYPDQSGDGISAGILRPYRDYQKTLHTRTALDFDDLTVFALKLLQESPLAYRLFTTTYRYILVDEFQDSDPQQLQLVTILAQHAIGTTVVGDDDQSIYAFRGAERRNIDIYASSVGAERIVLEANFRSDQVILEAAQAVISQDRGSREMKTLRATSLSRGTLRKCSFAHEEEEADSLSAEILRLIEYEKVPHSDIAVLARIGTRLGCICDALGRLGIPYFDRRSLGFHQSLTTDLALALLEIRSDLSSSAALSRLVEALEGGSLHGLHGEPDAIDMALKLKSQAASLVEPMLCESELATYLESVGLIRTLRWASDNDRIASRVTYDISTVCNTVVNTSRQYKLSLLETIAILRGEDAVQIMTTHASKGTEYSYVFLIGLEEGTLPSHRAKTVKDLAEERRIFYVSLTRAKNSAVLTHVRQRLQNGKRWPRQPSRFLTAIPDEYFTTDPVD